MNFLFANPNTTLLVILIVLYVSEKIYPLIFLKKDDKSKIETDMNNISMKVDGGLSTLEQKVSGAIHNHELKNKDEFACHSDKFYEKIDTMWEKIDAKYVSKELNRKQEERLEMVEKALSEIRSDVSEMKPYLEKINMIYTMLQDHINKDE